MREPMTGSDAAYLHYEADDARAHTLKCLILDTSHRGRPLTLNDVRAALGPRLGLHPRSRQRAMRAAALPARGFWVDDPNFELNDHLHEHTLAAPGGQEAFDALCGHLATDPLPLDRPPWDATLVHGLGDGRQAVVLRIHHAVSDGIAASNMLRAFTTEGPGDPVDPPEVDRWWPEPLPDTRALAVETLKQAPAYVRTLATFGREFVQKRRETESPEVDVKGRDDILGLRPAGERGWTGVRVSGQRLAASGQLSLDDARRAGRHFGVTINDVLVGVVGEAIAAESRARGEDHGTEVVGFSVAVDTDSERLWGNHLTPLFMPAHTDIADWGKRLEAISRTARDSAAVLRHAVAGRSVRAADLAARATPLAARHAGYRSPKISANVIMANVRGPETSRWLGTVEIADFISYAVVIPPVGVNITIYSYAGHLSVGLLTAPEVTREPEMLIGRLQDALRSVVANLE